MAILNSTRVNGQLQADAINIQAAAGQTGLSVTGNAIIDGNLEVNGDLTYVGTQDLRVEDKVIEVAYLNSGSVTPAEANGAGIVIGSEASPIASIKYKYVDGANEDRIQVSKKIEGTIESADHAASASKVDGKLTFGSGIIIEAGSGDTFDGSQNMTIRVSSDVAVDHAVTADTASRLANTFTIQGDGVATAVVFDGTEAKSVNLDMSAYETVAAHAADKTAQATINANLLLSGSAAAAAALADSKIYVDGKIAALDATIPAQEGKYISAISEVDGIVSATFESLPEIDVPEYSLEKVSGEVSGLAARYQLTKDSVKVGAYIDIPKDQFLKSAEFIAAATAADKAIDPAVIVGDPYLKFVFQTVGADTTSYVAVKGLVESFDGSNIVLTAFSKPASYSDPTINDNVNIVAGKLAKGVEVARAEAAAASTLATEAGVNAIASASAALTAYSSSQASVNSALSSSIASLDAATGSYMKADGSNSDIAASGLKFSNNAAAIKYNAAEEAFEFIFA